jgi:5-methylcytosine-specific restriction endonuclease McrA
MSIDLNTINDSPICNNHNMVYVKRYKSDFTPMLNMQCFKCGYLDNKARKIKEVPDINSIQEASLDLLNSYQENIRKFYEEKRERENKKQKEDWFINHYSPYLNSREWKDKRELVLKRDNYLCQSCLNSRATQVHHLTYKHVFNEPLFELTSVCKECHDLITKLDNTKP